MDHPVRPWRVKVEHSGGEFDHRLYEFAKRSSGKRLTDEQNATLDAFLAVLDSDGTVVDYDPNSADGWQLVPRVPEDDPDSIIHWPARHLRIVK